MKRFVKIVFLLVAVVIVLLLLIFFHNLKTEWVFRNEILYVKAPLEIQNMTFKEIEKSCHEVVGEYYPNAYLGEIAWITSSTEGLKSLSSGQICFTYCKKLGGFYNLYNYDCFVLIDVYVNLDKLLIESVNIGGNSQIGGLKRILEIPEFCEISNLLDEFFLNFETESQSYSIISSCINIYEEHIMVRVNVDLLNGTNKSISGKIKKYGNVYKFLPTRQETETQGDGSVVSND